MLQSQLGLGLVEEGDIMMETVQDIAQDAIAVSERAAFRLGQNINCIFYAFKRMFNISRGKIAGDEFDGARANQSQLTNPRYANRSDAIEET